MYKNKIEVSEIPLYHHYVLEEDVIGDIHNIQTGEYIAIQNQNNLSESFIYVKNDSNRKEKAIKWDGTVDVSWYSEDASDFHLHDPSQVAGIHSLLVKGYDFSDKCIYLESDIDISGYSWLPIGSLEIQNEEYKYNSIGEFNGIFDGLSHIIFGLHNDQKIPPYSFAFFMKTNEAQIKNLVFMDVDIRSDIVDMTASAVAVTSEKTIFSNILVFGTIESANVASISYFAKNSSFYSCKNRATLICRANRKKDLNVIVGGICGAITITKGLLTDKDILTAKVFSKCENYGRILADGTNIYSFYAGQLFGEYLTDIEDFHLVIEKCRAKSTIKVKNMPEESDAVYFGKSEKEKEPSNHINQTSKRDLLSGLIGRVSIWENIEIINLTDSRFRDNMVVPGTCNTLQSVDGDLSFKTVQADHISDFDVRYDLEPHFTFIKSVV